jgi:hypothetical protein
MHCCSRKLKVLANQVLVIELDANFCQNISIFDNFIPIFLLPLVQSWLGQHIHYCPNPSRCDSATIFDSAELFERFSHQDGVTEVHPVLQPHDRS